MNAPSPKPICDTDPSRRGGIDLNAAQDLLLHELYDAADRGAFAVACDGRSVRKNAWRLDKLGLASWCGSSWGSSFFAITAAGKARIDAEVSELRARLDASSAKRVSA